jgi:hypothetical protein
MNCLLQEHEKRRVALRQQHLKQDVRRIKRKLHRINDQWRLLVAVRALLLVPLISAAQDVACNIARTSHRDA